VKFLKQVAKATVSGFPPGSRMKTKNAHPDIGNAEAERLRMKRAAFSGYSDAGYDG